MRYGEIPLYLLCTFRYNGKSHRLTGATSFLGVGRISSLWQALRLALNKEALTLKGRKIKPSDKRVVKVMLFFRLYMLLIFRFQNKLPIRAPSPSSRQMINSA